jgi:two-component system sensor kinase
MADDAVKAVRRIASDLRPGILDDFGIVESMQWLAGDFEERFGIEARIDCRCEGVAPSKEQSTALFRILQEALTNVARHSEASRVEVRAECADGWFVLEVRDNGKGLRGDPAVSSLGIVGMRERATLLGGSFSAESLVLAGEVKGTCIRARIPVDSGGQETNASVRARNDE